MFCVTLRRLRILALAVGLTTVWAPPKLVAAPVPIGATDQANEPFAPRALLPSGGGPLAKWLGVLRQWNDEKHLLEACKADRAQCTNAGALEFLAMVDQAKGLSGRAQLGQINRSVNLTIRAASDGFRDEWSSPLATLARRSGDCEDYAILKFAALLEAGVAIDDLRLLIVRDSLRSEDHAIVAVRHDGQWLTLDNRHLLMLDVAELARYTPLLLLEGGGARRYLDVVLAPVDRRSDRSLAEPHATAQ